MNTIDCFAMGMATLGEEIRVFDWDKAARIIKERNPDIAEAGLEEDWCWTGGKIWENGAEVYNGCVYLASIWATPVLEIDGEIIPCWKMGKLLLFSDHTWFYCYEHQVDEFIRNHKWKLPDSALKYVMVYDGDMDYRLIKIKE